jgi:hypothetical protein
MILNCFLPNTLLIQREDCYLAVELVDNQNILFTITSSPSTALFLIKTTSLSNQPNNLDYIFIQRDSSIDLILTSRSSPSYSIILYSPPNVFQLQSYSIPGLSLALDAIDNTVSVDNLQSKISIHATDKPVKKDGLTNVIDSINKIPSLPPSPSHWITSLFYTILTSIYVFTSSIGFTLSTVIVKLLSLKITPTISLLDISSTLVQLHLRLTQALLWPGRWREWRSSPQLSHAKYIGYA